MLKYYFILGFIASLLILTLNLLALMLHKRIEQWTTIKTVDTYQQKLRAFCEGLEMRDIDTLMKGSAASFRRVGEVMATRIKELSAETTIREHLLKNKTGDNK